MSHPQGELTEATEWLTEVPSAQQVAASSEHSFLGPLLPQDIPRTGMPPFTALKLEISDFFLVAM